MSRDPLTRFEAEHREALGMLDRLEAAALERDLPALRVAHRALVGAVRTHNESEERALFPLLAEDAPVGPFIEEHVTLRRLERELDDMLLAADASGSTAVALVLVGLLRAHIEREDQVLFPMARALLGEAGLGEVARRLDQTS